jgi:hypothetical protein
MDIDNLKIDKNIIINSTDPFDYVISLYHGQDEPKQEPKQEPNKLEQPKKTKKPKKPKKPKLKCDNGDYLYDRYYD